ncbi:MAG TPA: PIG-L deacetylase family protein [Acidimicrobiales bacterium]|nr:PIG-L deacetylase family protein [Acidimicrobiales bacterium]
MHSAEGADDGAAPPPAGAGLRLAAVLAHPDDESRIVGGTLALYASRGARVSFYCATRGEAGDPSLPPERVGRLRERELRAACRILGVTTLRLGHFPDGGLDRVDPDDVVGDMVGFLRAEQPHVVVTFGPDGRTGHPDHIAVGALAEIAFDQVGDALAFPAQLAQRIPAWQPVRLYHTAVARSVASRIGWRHPSLPDNDLVAVDVSEVLDRKCRAAVEAHASQWALSPFNLAAGWGPFAVEHFRPLRPCAPSGEDAADLFSGLW